MDRYRRQLFALILAGLVLSISPTRSSLANGVERSNAGVLASAAPLPTGGAGLTASGPWRDRDVFIPVRRENRSGSGRGPLLPLAVIAAIVAAGLGSCAAGSQRARSRLTAASLRSRAPPAAAFLLLP
jgi:hypothetical protein